jgi:pyroglutamyl-peptidase
MKAIVSGFDAFSGMPLNPTAEIVKRIARKKPNDSFEEICPLVLPTTYDGASRTLIDAATLESPDIIVMLGLATDTTTVQLERIALNVRDTESPDNEGVIQVDRQVVAGGPIAYRTSLNLPQIQSHLRALGVQASISNHAGTFVCNSVYYSACHEVAVRGWATRVIFVHLPWTYHASEPSLFDASPMEVHERIARLLLRALRAHGE